MVHSKMDRISRLGAYGILVHDSKVLLTRKKSGPYKGLWDLPGGAIQFGETPEEALKRELLEESALAINQFEFSNIATAIGKYDDRSVPYEFHHTGLIYKVMSWSERSDLVPEEENRWAMLSSLQTEELTPFARHAVVALAPGKAWRPQNSIQRLIYSYLKGVQILIAVDSREQTLQSDHQKYFGGLFWVIKRNYQLR